MLAVVFQGQLMNFMQTCNSVTFYFMKKTHFLILTGSEILPNMIRAVNRGAICFNTPFDSKLIIFKKTFIYKLDD